MSSFLDGLYMALPLPVVLVACVGVYVFWLIAYCWFIYDAAQQKLYGVPLVGAAMMWSYEFCFVFIWKVTNPVWAFLEVVWLVADSIILYQCFKFMRATASEPILRRSPAATVLITMVSTLVILGGFIGFFEQTDGVLPAVFVVAGVALFFPLFAARRPHGETISRKAHFFRFLGDVCTAVCVYALFPWSGWVSVSEASLQTLNNVFTWFLLVPMLAADVLLLWYVLPEREELARALAEDRAILPPKPNREGVKATLTN